MLKIKHDAPHLEILNFLDVADKKAIKSYRATWKRKIRALKRINLLNLNNVS